MKYLYYKKAQVTSIWASMDIMVWWYPGYCTARCRAHGDPVVEIPHYYSPRAPERERERDPLTHNNNHPGGRRNMMVRANICPSIYQRTDAQTFWSWGEGRGVEGKPSRAILEALHTHDDDDDDEREILLLAGPLSNHVAMD